MLSPTRFDGRSTTATITTPKANIEKMHRGEGLTDADRAPWLATLHALVADVIASNQRCVLACSALKESYRDQLRPANASPGDVRFVYLDVPREVLEERLRERHGHFAPPALARRASSRRSKSRTMRCGSTARCPPAEIVGVVRDDSACERSAKG